MRKIFFCFSICFFSLVSCKNDFKKGEKGLQYKIISGDGTQKVKFGDFLQMHISQVIDYGKTDTVLSNTRTGDGPIIERFDSIGFPPEYFNIISKMKKGDSMILRLPTDSILSQNQGMPMPGFLKKGSMFLTTVKLINIFPTQKAADSARFAEFQIRQKKDSIENLAQIKKEDQVLAAYFTKNNLKPQKTPLGAYVDIINPGEGALLDTSVVAEVMYKGMTLDGKIFDTNLDSSKGHTDPLEVNMTNDGSLGGGLIKGWMDGMKQLRKGAKAKFFIPSPLGYGKQVAGNGAIPANSILIFEIEVTKVTSASIIRAERVKKMMEREAMRNKQDATNNDKKSPKTPQ